MTPRLWAWAGALAVLLAMLAAGGLKLRAHWISVGAAQSQPKIEAARREAASLRAALAEQNQRVQALLSDSQRLVSERDAAAQTIAVQARADAAPMRERAAAVMRESAPVGSDACALASAAFDAELRQERGQ